MLDDKDYKEKLANAQTEASKNEIQNAQKSKIATVAKWTAIGTAVAGVVAITKKLLTTATEYAGTVKDLAQLYSVTTEKVQELNYIAQESGKSAEWALRKAKSSGQEYYEVLGLTAEQYDKMVANAKEMGLIMSTDVLNSADALGDSVSALKYQWQAVLTTLLAGADNADEVFQNFVDRVIAFVNKVAPQVVTFAVKLAINVAIALVKIAPQLVAELISTLIDVIFETNWVQVGIDIMKAIAEGVINMFVKMINTLFGWLGVNIPEVDFNVGGGMKTSNVVGADYEITENSSQELTIRVESNGVTANDKAVASSLEDLIDEKIGKMLGGI